MMIHPEEVADVSPRATTRRATCGRPSRVVGASRRLTGWSCERTHHGRAALAKPRAAQADAARGRHTRSASRAVQEMLQRCRGLVRRGLREEVATGQRTTLHVVVAPCAPDSERTALGLVPASQ